MAAGIQLMQFYLAEALRIADAAMDAPDLLLAERLLQWARQYDYIYLRQIYQKAPIREIRNKKRAQEIVSLLVEHGRLKPVPRGLELEGAHRRDVWEIVKSDAA
jgi:hypothetical protein